MDAAIRRLRSTAQQLARGKHPSAVRISFPTLAPDSRGPGGRSSARLRGDARPAAALELEFLKELLAQREQALFGASSEQRPRLTPPSASAPPAPRRGHGPTVQPALPTVEVVHELAPADLTCPQCGGTLREMTGQTEDADEITVIERRFVLATHRRKKYRCACNGCVDTGPLRLAARPDRRGRRYSPDFAVEVAVNKYLDHLPLERQARVMSREGLTIESQTLWDQIEALTTVLQPTYDALRQYVLTAPVVGADETWWRLLGGPGPMPPRPTRRGPPPYMLGLWAGLTRFLTDARIPLDNNATERGLRGMWSAAKITMARARSAGPRSPRSSTASSRPTRRSRPPAPSRRPTRCCPSDVGS